MKNFIADGYDETAFVKEVPRMHSAVRFTYRPMLVEERSRFFQGNNKDVAESNRRAAKLLKERVIQWDIVGDNDKPLPITVDSILRLRPSLFERLLGIVIGLDAGDEDETWTEEEAKEAESLMEAAEKAGLPIGDARESRDGKN